MARYTEKDREIIEANKGVSPHDLLTQHGLSEAGFNALTEELSATAQRDMNANKMGRPRKNAPVTTDEPPAMPNIPDVAAKPAQTNVLTASTQHILKPIVNGPIPRASNSATVRIRPKGTRGNGIAMSRSVAESQLKRYPNSYEIVQ